MLGRTLLRALEHRGHRPVMAKARGPAGRPRPAPPAAPVTHPGETFFPEEERTPRGRSGRGQPLPVLPRSHGGHGGSRGEVTHRPPTARQPLPDTERALDMEEEGEVAEVARGSAYTGGSVDDDGGVEEEVDEVDEGDGLVEGTQRRAAPLGAGVAVSAHQPHRRQPAAAAATAVAAAGGSGADPQHSKEAYRFLLDHIDAEIAALQRRHTTVTTRRQNLEERNTHRIKELFDFMESPWLLLPTEVQPPLPATGVDVYLKEQRLKRASEPDSAASDAQDKMFVLACHKNYRSLPASEKRFYEQAATFNAAVRQELKYRLATGCSRFEAFCQQVRECTAAMARAGQVPERPAPWAHGGASRYQGLSKWQRDARQAAHTAHAGGSPAAHSGEDAAEVVGKARVGAAQRVRAAAKRIKGAGAAPSATAQEAADEEADAEVNAQAPPRAARARAHATAKPKAKAKAAVRPPPKKTAAVGGKKAVAKKGAGGKGGGAQARRPSKAEAAFAGPGPKGRSPSIPLPDLDKLAIRKLKKAIAPPAAKKKSVKAAKPPPGKAAGKKKKR